MKMVVGLGNPGPRYERTRHNAGFMVIDRTAADRVAGWQNQFDGSIGRCAVGRGDVILLKPNTFMNRSGHSIGAAASYYGIEPAEVLIVHDELDLAFGTVRLKFGGGVAGHNGLRSASERLGTQDYARLRVGIGRPGPEFGGSIVDYVLEAFPPGDEVELDRVLGVAADAVRQVIEDGFSVAMNRVNRRGKE